MEPLTFVYVFPVRLEFEMKTNLDCTHPASDGCFREKKKKKLSFYFLRKQTQGQQRLKCCIYLASRPVLLVN